MNPIVLANRRTPQIYRLDLNGAAGANARQLFQEGERQFEASIEQLIPFEPGYKPEDDECFQINNFDLDAELMQACRNPLSFERIESSAFAEMDIFGMVGYDFTAGSRKVYFQNFDTRKIFLPGGKFAIWRMTDQSTFQELDRPMLVLDPTVSVIWDNGTLKFKSYHLAKMLVDLSGVFSEATDEDLDTFASHGRLRCSDQAAFRAVCNSWSRTKIAMILRGGILDSVTSEHIQFAAGQVEYRIEMDGDRVVLPSNKGELRELLQFLDEDIFRGVLSQRRLLSSGKRTLE